MNRQIKFRLFNEDTDEMFYLGDVEQYDNGVMFPTQNNEHIDTSRCQLMQYTGLKDVDGQEIYEGDIVKHFSGLPCLVVWDYNYCGYGLKANNFICSLMDYDPSKHCKVLGNIHQHKDLMMKNN